MNFSVYTNDERMKDIHDKIIAWIENFFKDKKGPAVIGISGGKDSTICAALLTEALGKDRVIGVMLPNGEQKDISDSKKVIDTLGIRSVEINIKGMYNDLTSRIGDWFEGDEIPSLYVTNTPARLRMVTLYSIAALYSGFVCNTCNKSEDYVGYSTKYGDAAGEKVYAKEVSGDSKRSELTVTELRDFLNELIEAGYGDYDVEADTQDGDSYSVRNEVLAFDLSKTVRIF